MRSWLSNISGQTGDRNDANASSTANTGQTIHDDASINSGGPTSVRNFFGGQRDNRHDDGGRSNRGNLPMVDDDEGSDDDR